jgi:hypothetical protein
VDDINLTAIQKDFYRRSEEAEVAMNDILEKVLLITDVKSQQDATAVLKDLTEYVNSMGFSYNGESDDLKAELHLKKLEEAIEALKSIIARH